MLRLLPFLFCLFLLHGCHSNPSQGSNNGTKVDYSNSPSELILQAYAARLAEDINTTLIAKDFLTQSLNIAGDCTTQNQCPPSAFETSFSAMLQDELLTLGVPTTKNALSSDLTISFTSQLLPVIKTQKSTSTAPQTKYKVMITSSILSESSYIFTDTALFSVPAGDVWQFTPSKPATTIPIRQSKTMTHNKTIKAQKG